MDPTPTAKQEPPPPKPEDKKQVGPDPPPKGQWPAGMANPPPIDLTAPDRSDLYRARSVELFRVPGRPIGWLDLSILALLLLVALLAWLARRWQQLEVLYKCVLISLIIHLLLLWWFRRVEVEPKEIEMARRPGLFQVRLASARPASGTRERGHLEGGVP